MPVAAPPDGPTEVPSGAAPYLRRLRTWAYTELQRALLKSEAAAFVLLQSPSGAVFQITVGDDGRLVSTPIVLATGRPGSPALTFAPVTRNGMISAASPAGTTSATYVMMGLALPLQAAAASNAMLIIAGVIANTVNNAQTDCALFFGTGTPPTNGVAPPAGSVQIGQPTSFKSSSGSGGLTPFSLTGIIPITPGQTSWVDLALEASAGTASVSQIDAIGVGLA